MHDNDVILRERRENCDEIYFEVSSDYAGARTTVCRLV